MEIDRPITIAVILFIILVLGFYFVVPKYKEFKELQLEISTKEAELKGKEKYFSEVVKAFEKLTKYQESVEKIDSALPPHSSLASLVYFLQEKSALNGIIIQNIGLLSIRPITEKKEIKEILLSLQLYGSYFSFKNFLSSLEKSARLIDVENISFVSKKETIEAFSISLIIKVHSY